MPTQIGIYSYCRLFIPPLVASRIFNLHILFFSHLTRKRIYNLLTYMSIKRTYVIHSSAMNDMGDKINSKKIAKAAGCFVIPGFEGIAIPTKHLFIALSHLRQI